ncbi:hypothetical protein MRX96_021541 [Rhipicephalus microplus]
MKKATVIGTRLNLCDWRFASAQRPTCDESELSHLLLKRRNYTHTVALIGCSLASVAACVIILLLLIPAHGNSPEVHEWLEDVCATRACDRQALFLQETMQPSADTCREFGTLMCGRWTHDHAVAMDVDAQLRESALRQDARFLRNYTGKFHATQEARRMLNSCLEQQSDQEARRAALRTFRNFLRDRGLPWPNEPTGGLHPFDVLLDLAINWRIDLWFGVRLCRKGLAKIQFKEAPVTLSTMLRAEHADELQTVAEVMFYAEAVGGGLQYTKLRAKRVATTHTDVLLSLRNISSINPRLKQLCVTQIADVLKWTPAVTSVTAGVHFKTSAICLLSFRSIWAIQRRFDHTQKF